MDVQNCIATIQGKPTGLFKFRVTFQEKIKCITELAQYKDRHLDSIVMSATRDEEPYVQEVACAVMVSRFNELSGVREVEARLGQMLLRGSDPGFWLGARPRDEAVVLVCIATVNHSGYVRQAALGQMATYTDWRYIPFILRRAGDWVQQVRDQARATLAQYKTADFRLGFLAALPDIEALLSVKRVDLRPVYQDVMHWLVQVVDPEQLLTEVEGLSDTSRSRVVRYLLTDHLCGAAMLRAFINDRSFLIRSAAVRHLLTRTEPWSSELLEHALSDAFPNIRASAFKELIRRGAASEEMLTIGLTDTSFEVRQQAAKQVGLSKNELLRHYEDRLKAANRIAGSLLGLSDYADPDLAEVISPFADHSDNVVRRAALFALAKIAPTAAYDHALVMIVDRNKRIRSKAESILLEHHDQGVVERGRELMGSESVMHRSVGLSLLNKFGGWQSLATTLGACVDPSSRISDLAWAFLDAWAGYARRLFTNPTAEDIDRARSAMVGVRSELAAPTYQQKRTLDAVEVFLA